MHPTFQNTLDIASKIFEIAQELGQNPARKTRGVLFVSEGASEHLRGLISEATQRPEESCDIPEPEGALKKFRNLLPFSDQYSSCVRHIAGRVRSSPDAIFEISGFDNFNHWEKGSLLECLAEGHVGEVFSPDRVSLVDATFIVRVNSGFPAGSIPFESFLNSFHISSDDAARVHFHGCF